MLQREGSTCGKLSTESLFLIYSYIGQCSPNASHGADKPNRTRILLGLLLCVVPIISKTGKLLWN